MKYAQLQSLAATMEEKEMQDSLASLLNDTRFAAVVKLLERQREQFVVGGSQQALAGHHGVLAHNAGSIYALDIFALALKQRAEPPKPRGQQAPPTK